MSLSFLNLSTYFSSVSPIENYFLTGREGTMGCLLYKSPKFYICVFLLFDSTTLGTIIEFGWFKPFQQLIVFFCRGNFVEHHWECTPLYRPLSYSFRSLIFSAYLPTLVPTQNSILSSGILMIKICIVGKIIFFFSLCVM